MKLTFGMALIIMIASQVMNRISVENLPELQSRAASGDSEVAIDLFHYFLAEKSDPTEASFWLRISAEQGSCEGMIEYGKLLGGALGQHDARKLWFGRASSQGCDMSRAQES